MKDGRKSAVNGEKVCQLKFVNLSMELELKEEADIKEDMEEDMFANDVDLGNTFNFNTGEVIDDALISDDVAGHISCKQFWLPK